MELDLTAGLAQLKTTAIVAETPALETAPESESPSFAALLDTEPQPEIDVPTPNLTQNTPPVMDASTPDPSPAKVSDEAPADIPAVDAAAPAPAPQLAPPPLTTPPPAQPGNRTPAAPLPAIQAPVQTPVRARPNQPTPAAATPETLPPTAPEAKAPAPSATTSTPTPPAPAILAATPAKTAPEPRAEIPAKEAEAIRSILPERTAPKGPKEPATAFAPSINTAPLEPAQEQSSELTFGLKIERQVIETAHSLRPTPHQSPAPVATQISSQLPQLLSKAEKQTVELRLDPPELGRVTIHITTHDQQVTAHVVAERVDTVDLMRRHADLLTATLARAGFSQSDLSFQQGKGGNSQGGFEHFQGFSGMAEADTAPQPAPTLSGLDGRLDIRL